MAESDLKQLASALRVISQEGRSVANELLRQARQVDGVASRAASSGLHERSSPGTGRVVALLEQASRSLRQAAESLDAAARSGDAFSGRLAGGGAGSGGGGSNGDGPPGEAGDGHDDDGSNWALRDALAFTGDAFPDGTVIYRERSGHQGEWNPRLMEPEPNSVYVVDERTVYRTDHLGRVVEVFGLVDKGDLVSTDENKSRRHKGAQGRAGGEDREGEDDGGHLRSAQLGGAGEALNLIAQSRDENRARKNVRNWRAMELSWEREVKAGAQIEVAFFVNYSSDSLRPSSYSAEWIISRPNERPAFDEQEFYN